MKIYILYRSKSRNHAETAYMQLLMGSTDQEIGALNRENNEIGTASVSKIIINDTIDLFFKLQSAVW